MEKTPYIGRLDTMVTILRNMLVQGSGGAHVPTSVEICKTYACCESDTGALVTDEKVHHVVKSVFVIRYRPDILGVAELELAADGLKYKVTHVEKIRRSHLRIHCTDPDAWAQNP